ncbi:AMP-binding protein [Mycolicibacter heraklionensis]|uniref:AMP-binding protein n=1 Tax=Mycolicibacter heraklionensis TaxID=512402 RepID=A0A9X7ZDV2_9MYCO|nr:AMP-binding protein [Mycolicibacter heraklionensis]QZA06966.1 AMP-binding protein [Mycolicibacter heraklionensis]
MVYGIAQHAERDDGVALTDGVAAWTWPQLNSLLNRAVHWLLSLGVEPGQRIAVMAENSAHTALAHLATTYAGLSVVPVSYHLAAGEVGYILRDASVHTVLCSARAAATVREADLDVAVVGWDEFDRAVASYSGAEPSDAIAPAAPLYYTSGTTGRPKGVELPAQMFPGGASMVDHVEQIRASRIRPAGKHLVVAPMHHTGPITGVRGLMVGTALVIAPKFDAEAVLAAIDAHRIASSMMVPTHFSRMLALTKGIRDRYDVSSLRSVIHTGAACPVHVKRAMIDWFGPVFIEAYGSTEAGTITMIDSGEWLAHPGSVGRALPGCEVTIRSEDGTVLPSGESGLVCVESTTGHRPSYHGDPEKTRRSYVADGVFAIGEIGYLDADGYLYLTDRASDMVVSGGVNLYPAESEEVLRTHGSVRDVAVIGIPHDDLGEQLCALVVADPGTDPAELVAWCRDRLSHYKCPSVVELVEFELRSAMGKINKRQLRDGYLAARRPSEAVSS